MPNSISTFIRSKLKNRHSNAPLTNFSHITSIIITLIHLIPPILESPNLSLPLLISLSLTQPCPNPTLLISLSLAWPYGPSPNLFKPNQDLSNHPLSNSTLSDPTIFIQPNLQQHLPTPDDLTPPQPALTSLICPKPALRDSDSHQFSLNFSHPLKRQSISAVLTNVYSITTHII